MEREASARPVIVRGQKVQQMKEVKFEENFDSPLYSRRRGQKDFVPLKQRNETSGQNRGNHTE